MKNLAIIFVVVAGISLSVSNTGCTTTDPPAQNDTTDTTGGGGGTPIVNSFRLGLDDYELNLNTNLTEAYFDKAANKTLIFVNGNDGKHGDAAFTIELDSNYVGSFVCEQGERNIFEMETGAGVTKEYFTSEGASMTVNVQNYGAVGEPISGTFTGTVKKGINTVNLTKGKFSVERSPDK